MVGGIIDSMNMSLNTHWELTKAWLGVFYGIPKDLDTIQQLTNDKNEEDILH